MDDRPLRSFKKTARKAVLRVWEVEDPNQLANFLHTGLSVKIFHAL